jgi:peptidoglycan L-alanyl-D-glutamate endopeptidase CwlK
MAQRHTIDLNLLWRGFREPLQKVLDDLYEDGLDFRATSGFRGKAEQDKLYAQGRTTPGPIVTNAVFGSSYHNFGLAADLTRFFGKRADWTDKNYAMLGAYAKNHGLKWGGDFKSIKDLPHIEFPLNSLGLTLADLRKVHAKDGVPGVWKLLDAAFYG